MFDLIRKINILIHAKTNLYCVTNSAILALVSSATLMTSMGSDPNRFPRVFLLGVNQEALNSPAYLQELVRLLSQSSSDEESGTDSLH